MDYFKKIAKNLLSFLNNSVQTKIELEEFLKYVSYPKINYNQNLLNAFDKEKLDIFFRKTFNIIPILDNTLFEKKVVDVFYDNIFKAAEINGWYADEVEVIANPNNIDPIYIYCHIIGDMICY